MTQVVTFQRYRPPARYDNLPWTAARVREGLSSVGPWSTIDTLPLSPLDTNPASPVFRNLTTALASDTPGLWYQIVFLDALADVSLPTTPVQNVTPTTPGDDGGPCTDWITGADVAACCESVDASDDTIFDAVAREAQALLFQLSGRLFAGTCERVVRPCRTTTCQYGYQVLSRGFVIGWYGYYWGWAGTGVGVNWPNGTPCGCRSLSRVKLSGYPVQAITEVLIDGQVVDPATYRLDRQRDLVRLRDPAHPDVVLRWPACQAMDLPDTETGTWSVSYTHGAPVPSLGAQAATQLACELYKECAGQKCALPKNVARVTRQNVTIERAAFVSWAFQKGVARIPRGWTSGLPLVDAFLGAYNKNGLSRRPVFWSPASNLQYPLPVES